MNRDPADILGEIKMPPPVDTGDRLSFTLFVALALHSLLVFGVTFKLPAPADSAPTLEITLATYKAAQAPEKADFVAQHNQEASGTEDTTRQLTTDQLADFSANEIRDISKQPQIQASARESHQDPSRVTTISHSTHNTPARPDKETTPDQVLREGQAQELPALSTEIASLQAKLDRQRQEYAKRPRIRRLTSVSTRESFDARYLHEWSARIEQIGNRNYPQEALSRRITGTLRLEVSLNPNGSIHQVEILQSSGQRILDDAALQIVRLAAPFNPFPDEIRQHYDRLNIIRTWRFEITGLSTSSE